MTSSADKSPVVEQWFPGIVAANDDQATVMQQFASMFEDWYCDQDADIPPLPYLRVLRDSITVEKIFRPSVMENASIFETVYKSLIEMELVMNPKMRPNSRYFFKVAHIIYPGEEFASLREQASAAVRAFVDDQRKKKNTDNVGAGPASTTPTSSRGAGISPRPVFNDTFSSPPAPVVSSAADSNAQMQTMMMMMMANMMDKFGMAPIASTVPQTSAPANAPPPTVRAEPVALPAAPLSTPRHAVATGPVNDARRDDHQRTARNVHHDIANRFKGKESKYSGSENEDLQEFLAQYSAVARDYQLTASQKRQYLHNLLRGDALRFYNEEIEGRYSTYNESVSVLSSHFNSLDKQQRVKADLSTLSLATFASREGGSVTKGLSSLAEYISSRAPQCPVSFRHESHKVDFLRNAVIAYPWAQPVLSCVNQETRYQGLFTQLANALQVHEEARHRNQPALTNSAVHSKSGGSSSEKPFILFTQPRYQKKLARKLFPGSREGKECWNCGTPGHRLSQCRKPLDATAIAARKAAFYDRKNNSNAGSKRVLYELASGLNELLETAPADSGSTVATAYFLDNDDCSDSSSSSSDDNATGQQIDIPAQTLHASNVSDSDTSF